MLALIGGATHTASAGTGELKTYVVVFAGEDGADGTYAVESTYAVLCSYAVGGSYAVTGVYAVGCDYAVSGVYAVYAVAHQYAVSLVGAAGGTVASDMLKQIGVIVVQSANPAFVEVMRGYSGVAAVAADHKWKAVPTAEEALASGELVPLSHPGAGVPGGGPQGPHNDALESEQWSMRNIEAPAAHAIQAGSRLVEVGILDTGIECTHPDFVGADGTNLNCMPPKAADFVTGGPGVGIPGTVTDNGFHGTHVAGIVGARVNTIGVVGVAPNVTLIPVKVCDTVGFCYASSTVRGIVHAGDQKFEVINMSFFVDDDLFLQSTEFKCMNVETQRTFRRLNERAIQYARNQGVVPVAALGNSDEDLAHPSEPFENNCEVVPAETQGVIGTMALGRFNEKAGYSNYGSGMTDVAAPGGNFGLLSDTPNEFCEEQVLSTVPAAFGFYGCFQGTSMASPHAAGVAALIVSQFGRVGTDAGETDVVMRPQDVESKLQATTIDQGLPGYDECFGNGRINALRAVQHDTSRLYDATAPFCPEYEE
jgi:subtilisin family serine protease